MEILLGMAFLVFFPAAVFWIAIWLLQIWSKLVPGMCLLLASVIGVCARIAEDVFFFEFASIAGLTGGEATLAVSMALTKASYVLVFALLLGVNWWLWRRGKES